MISYILSSEKRKRIASAILALPGRQWSCPSIEEATGISHATAFRTLTELARYGLLKTVKLSRKNIIFELVESPLTDSLRYVIEAEKRALTEMARTFVQEIHSPDIVSCILFGSVAKGSPSKDSDIDVLVLTRRYDKRLESEIQNKAAEISADFNRTISATVMSARQFKESSKKKSRFEQEILEDGVVLYGKKPSGTGKAVA